MVGGREAQVMWGVLLGLPCSSVGKESACNAGDLDLIAWLGRSPGKGKSYLLQYSDLENSMDCIVRGVAELDRTERLSLSHSYCLVLCDHIFLAIK